MFEKNAGIWRLDDFEDEASTLSQTQAKTLRARKRLRHTKNSNISKWKEKKLKTY